MMNRDKEKFAPSYIDREVHDLLKRYCNENSLLMNRLCSNIILDFLISQGYDAKELKDKPFYQRLNSFVERRAKEKDFFPVEKFASTQIRQIKLKQAENERLLKELQEFEAEEEPKNQDKEA